MHPSLPLVPIALVALAATPALAADPKVPNPWSTVPVGTVLEIAVTVDETTYLISADRDKNMQHRESRETWTVVAKDARTLTLEKHIGADVTRETIDLAPVDADPAPPSGHGVSRDDLRTWSGEEDVILPFGTVHCTVYSQNHAQLESSRMQSEWKNPHYPIPLKTVDNYGGGAGQVHEQITTRTLVRFDRGGKLAPPDLIPSGDWHAAAIGTRYTIGVTEDKVFHWPNKPAPEHKAWTEEWTLVGKTATSATFHVEAPDGTSDKTVDETPVVAGTTSASQSEHTEIEVDAQTIDTPLGKLACTHSTRRQTMIDAGGVDEEWRAATYPVPVKSVSDWGAKQTDTTTTRILVKVSTPAK